MTQDMPNDGGTVDLERAVRRGTRRAVRRLLGLWIAVVGLVIVMIGGGAAARDAVHRTGGAAVEPSTGTTSVTATGRLAVTARGCSEPQRGERSTCTLDLTSTGTAAVTISRVTLEPRDSREDELWTISESCTGRLDPGRSCEMAIDFAAPARPGEYSVDVIIHHDGDSQISTAVLSSRVQAAPSLPPRATIRAPRANQQFIARSGAGGATVRLVGIGTDPEDGELPGTALQWTARADGNERVLCTGSRFAAAIDGLDDATGSAGRTDTTRGNFSTLSDCSDHTAIIPPPPTAPRHNEWVIELRAVDSGGTFSSPERRTIMVRHPPEG